MMNTPLSRRHFAQWAGVAALTSGSGLLAAKDITVNSCVLSTKENQSTMTPEAALKRLKDGNARFVTGQTVNCDLMKQVKQTADGQFPFATIVGCIDSRVPPELVFDQRIGDLFAARIAGNFVNDDIIGSLEFATKVSGSKLVVVLGHTECGAIKGTIDNVKMGLLTQTLSNIQPSLKRLNYQGEISSKNKELVQKLADQNAKDAVENILKKSAIIAEMVKANQVKVVSAMHHLKTGQITWL